ncbi:MAG TPA: hypothetical protein VLA04_04130 [Verrucomicrobiae bacterium]|nr:hypothetical protein [Verrucomicrobiae bacterium]
MATQSDPQTTFAHITGDFRSAWDALSKDDKATNRGNFMFALQAMILLEWIMRLCSTDTNARDRFLGELNKIDSRYFTRLPAPGKEIDRELNPPRDHEWHLIWSIFDVIRNGQAHQYEQIIVTLPQKKSFAFSLAGGAELGSSLSQIPTKIDRKKYLGYRVESGHGWIYLHAGLLFLDIESAILSSNILCSGLNFPYLTRPRSAGSSHYKFTLTQLEQALIARGHNDLSSTASKGAGKSPYTATTIGPSPLI